jgi:hypothetical protein
LPFLFSKGHGILLKHPVDVGVITLEDVKIETGTAKEILHGVAGKAVILSVMLIGKRRPRCHDEVPKRFVLFHLLNHPRQELESLIWLKHDDARFPQPSIERAMIPQRCAKKLCISLERVSQAVFHVFTSSARLRMIPLIYVDFLSNHPGHGSHSYLVVDLYGLIDKPSAA